MHPDIARMLQGAFAQETTESVVEFIRLSGLTHAQWSALGADALPTIQAAIDAFLTQRNVQDMADNLIVGREDDLHIGDGQVRGQEAALEQALLAGHRERLEAAGYPRWALFNELTGGTRSLESIEVLRAFEAGDLQYRPPILSSGFGKVPFEQYGKERVNGELQLIRRRARSSKGQLGRSLLTEEPQIRADLERAFRAALRENYRRLINHDRTVNTGVLLRSIEQGQLNVGGELDFDYTIADLPGEPRPGREESERRLSTHQYGPIVFQGRRSITSVNPMVFQSGGKWRRTLSVAPAAPRPVLELTQEQIERIDEILLRGINDDIEEWLTENEGVL